jgi:hypothetical protein
VERVWARARSREHARVVRQRHPRLPRAAAGGAHARHTQRAVSGGRKRGRRGRAPAGRDAQPPKKAKESTQPSRSTGLCLFRGRPRRARAAGACAWRVCA